MKYIYIYYQLIIFIGKCKNHEMPYCMYVFLLLTFNLLKSGARLYFSVERICERSSRLQGLNHIIHIYQLSCLQLKMYYSFNARRSHKCLARIKRHHFNSFQCLSCLCSDIIYWLLCFEQVSNKHIHLLNKGSFGWRCISFPPFIIHR